ncbi:Anhydro-N-acetylmuramic acid kinase [Rhodobacteraceae bacterium THAF1]|uniref:anhydro-N-acetylmuramic acid kinase n=1 Tax=Palleronia sp. THAF1 TaxID=2587842 RepID=UPI000F3DBF4C|nr:anhydro-N-acetylmuramic acid kinase [Palleronia sp. THAF1]QFU08238.1 Anhydro-N-acetylmuramic acid kinase [Palleronia sp. THAF1]VDC28794.1 Anhydro-N-acetylmuramic acid kinase [Rhodobacteraceae bacterium THAF1]
MLKEALKRGPVWALGTMSGTSLDGVDAAMVLTDGADVFGFGETAYRAYSEKERDVLAAALGQWDDLEAASQVVEGAHAEVLSDIAGADVIGFHGQTTAHDPGGRGTCQIGDGRLLAHVLDTPVVWDFRSADVAMGGQGAPLAPFFHHAALRFVGVTEPSVVLNLGGVGNLTFVNPSIAVPSEAGACLAFDTGPANAPLNDLMQVRLKRGYDEDGALAARGMPGEAVLERLAKQAFFRKIPPKSLDRDDFAWLNEAVAPLPDADAAATLTAAVAVSVALAMEHLPAAPARILVTGGGRKNTVMMDMIAKRTGLSTVPIEEVGLNGDMLEAQAFAYLAVRALRGWPTSGPGTTGVPAAVGGGVVSYPGDILDLAAG